MKGFALLACSILASEGVTGSEIPAPSTHEAETPLVEQYVSWKRAALSASICARSNAQFEREYGERIASIDDWFSRNFPDSDAVKEDPVIVLGFRCTREVDGLPKNVVEDHFDLVTKDLIEAIKLAEAA